jgi:predicted RNase H-like HicB family nuclease
MSGQRSAIDRGFAVCGDNAAIRYTPGPPIMMLTAVLMPAPEGGFTALNPETGTTSEGESVEEAIANLREATELYLEEFPLAPVGQPLVTTFKVAEHA